MNKIDFALIITVEKANPNGDPTNGNRPRIDFDGYGEISDVCLKRKIRNRLQDMGQSILMQANERSTDGHYSVKGRVKSNAPLQSLIDKNQIDEAARLACKDWIDVRSFGQVLALGKKADTASFSIRGPVTIQIARSLDIVDIEMMQFARTINTNVDTREKDSSTLPTKSFITKGAFITYGSIFPQLADKTGFSNDDADLIRKSLQTLFENDASAARPSGSMAVARLYWWEHDCQIGQYPSIKVHRSIDAKPIDVFPFFEVEENHLEGLMPEVFVGI